MKKILFITLFIISSIGVAQNNYIVKTDDGRRVLLKADYTWEYIDTIPEKEEVEENEIEKLVARNGCNLPNGYKEPKLNNKLQSQLRKGRATVKHIKMKVAEDYNCTVDDVILLSVSEKRSDGFYDFCANGKKVSYKRVGNTIIRKNH